MRMLEYFHIRYTAAHMGTLGAICMVSECAILAVIPRPHVWVETLMYSWL